MRSFIRRIPKAPDFNLILYQQLGIQQARPFSFLPEDEVHLKQQATAFQQGGAVALHLMQCLQGAPLVMEDNKQKLPDEVKSGLSLHARRHSGSAKTRDDGSLILPLCMRF